MSEAVFEKRVRRKLGKNLHEPIMDLWKNRSKQSSVKFVEEDEHQAMNTRAAACMFIKRTGLNLTTSVRKNEVLVMCDKDYPGTPKVVDLRNGGK